MKKVISFFSSFGLATFLLVLLLIYTTFGTLEQPEHGLYATQVKYFESIWLTSIDLGSSLRALNFPCPDLKLPVLLPGGYTVMALFCLNIILGGIIRIRKSPRTIGVIIAHFSMVFMIVAGGVSMHAKIEGNLSVMEGQTDDQFFSLDLRDVEIEQISPAPAEGKRSVMVIPDKHFADLVPAHNEGRARTFTHADLPFELTLSNYSLNSQVKRAEEGSTHRDVADGYYIQPLPPQTEHGQNMPAIYASVKDLKTGQETKGILWLQAAAPWTIKADGKTFTIDLVRRWWQLPYEVKLVEAIREFHPGTERPRRFASIVTQLQDGREERKEITMNEPLRSGGFTLFQHQMMSADELQRTRNASVFQVVSNPSDQWPLWSCIAVGIGLLIHFLSMFGRTIRRTQKKAAAAETPTAEPVTV
jgi:hypothetical protein